VTRPTLVLLTRPDCGLCAEMLAALHVLGQRVPLPPVMLQDVDADPALARRYGLKIPVLLLEGDLVCSARFDETALLAALRSLERRQLGAPAILD
jgi:hypothetical protein